MAANDRYSCQIKLDGFGATAQVKLTHAKILIVGAGGLGCPAAQYLTAAGVGTIAIADFDTVSVSNLHRQILYVEQDAGRLKVDVAIDKLARLNSHIKLIALPVKVTVSNVCELVGNYDIILDCSDNFAVRTVLNDGCVLTGKPLVYGAAYQYEGQVAVWNVANEDGTRSPHYRDIFPDVDHQPEVDCATGGVMPTLTGIIGCMQATEAIKYLCGQEGLLASKLLVLNVQTMQSYITQLPLTSWTTVTELSQAASEISAEALRLELASHKYRLIDVRSMAEHTIDNIGGELMPLSDILDGTIIIDTSRPTVFYCSSGRRSASAVGHVVSLYPGFDALSLAGGIEAWKMESS